MKNNAYQLSKNYELLWDLVQEGKLIACFFDDEGANMDGFVRKVSDGIEIKNILFPSDVLTNKEQFVILCKSYELGYIKPSPSPVTLALKEALKLQYAGVDGNKKVWLSARSKSYSLNEMLTEIENQTEVGIELEVGMNKLLIDLLLRGQETLDEIDYKAKYEKCIEVLKEQVPHGWDYIEMNDL